ncbi:hypothetical protein ILYODFUR_016669 [Ilyodon furcidens]|uniref:Secreted protein n=1 Tax=Ilyodon furcidens TaxID=33524 RepID=A0ABV0UWI3_9TELE
MLLDLLLVSTSVPAFYLLICLSLLWLTLTQLSEFDAFPKLKFFGYPQLCDEAVFSLSTHPTLCQTPSWVQTRHIRPCLAIPKQEAATVDSLSYYLGHRPAMPLTLCHIAYSHYKP